MKISNKTFSISSFSSSVFCSLVSLQVYAQQAATNTAPATSITEPQQVAGNASQSTGAPAWINFALIAGIILFMWLFVFRPQSKRAKEQKEFLSSLTPGIEVITSGGIIGTIVDVKDNIVSLNIGNSTIRVLKNSISGKLATDAVIPQK